MQDASHVDEIGTWIIYLYLIFPQKLVEPQAQEQLKAALNDRIMCVLYRDELINAIDEFNNLEKNSRKENKVPKKELTAILKGFLFVCVSAVFFAIKKTRFFAFHFLRKKKGTKFARKQKKTKKKRC